MQGGLPTVLSQTFRTLVHSRLQVGFATYGTRYENAEFILLEPDRDQYEMFFSNVFSLSSRQAVCELAYDATRRDLLRRAKDLVDIVLRQPRSRSLCNELSAAIHYLLDVCPHQRGFFERTADTRANSSRSRFRVVDWINAPRTRPLPCGGDVLRAAAPDG